MAKDILHGIAVSPGIAIGKAHFMSRQGFVPAMRQYVAQERVDAEVRRLHAAFQTVAAELEHARNIVPGNFAEHTAVLTSHLMICRDPKLIQGTTARIREQKIRAEWALDQSLAEISKTFEAIDDEYIRERIQDVHMVADRVMARLIGETVREPNPEEKIILLAHDISPADAIELSLSRIISFVTQEGGKASHTGILARGQHIPALVGVIGLEGRVPDGAQLIVDAIKGFLLVEPDESELKMYRDLAVRFEQYHQEIRRQCMLPASTTDGLLMSVLANIEGEPGASVIQSNGGEGVGLYRTEYGFMNRSSLPSEEELYQEYKRAVTDLAPQEVTFRTLDVGAEKLMEQQKEQHEANPALGLRGIRYCLQHQALFKRQMRAILRAGTHGNVAIMFPMISSVEELDHALDLLSDARRELDDVGIPYARELPVGVMIEVPSAVILSKVLADKVDFFSIGTNDLVQYLLGIDRTNPHVANLYQPLHPAVLRSLKHTVDAAHQAGIDVCVCGEMANDPYCIPVLLGLPVDSISVPAEAIPGVKDIIRHFAFDDCLELVRQLLRTPHTNLINRMVCEFVYARIPEKLAFHLPFNGIGD